MQGRGERGRRGAGVGFWRGWGRASQLCSQRWTLRLKTRRERTRDWVNPGCGGRDSDGFGWGSVPVVLPGSPLRLGTRRERGRGGANPGGAGRGSAHGGDGEEFPVVLSGVATAAGNAHFVRSWVPKDRHPVGAAEGCGPQVRELGLRGAGNQVFRRLLAHSRSSPTWRSQKSLAFGVKAFTAPPLC